MKLKRALFLSYIFLLPMDRIQYFSIAFGPIHVTILDVLLVVMLYLVLLEAAISRREVSPFIKLVCVLLLAAALSSSVSLLYISDQYISYDIKTTLNILECTALIFVSSHIVDNMAFLKKAIKFLCLSLFIVSVATILKSLGVDLPGQVRLIYTRIGPFYIGTVGLMDHILGYSLLVCAAFPFVIGKTLFKSRLARYIYFVIYVTASIIIYTRGLWLAMAVQLLVVMVLSFVMGKGLFKRTFVAIAWSGTIAVLAVYAHTIYTALVEMREGTVSARFAGYSKVLVAATSSPLNFLFGSGKGAFIYKYELTMPHNFVLDLLVGKGIITVIIACLVFYIISARLVALAREQKGGVRRTGEGFEVPLIVALAGFFIMGMSAPITNSIILWTLLAVACSFISIVGEEEEIRVRLQDTARDVPELRSSRTGEARASLGPLMADGRTP